MSSVSLREYQRDALVKLRAEYAAGKKRVMLFGSCGFGKTEVAIAMMQGARDRGRRCLFVVDRVELVSQASRRLLKSGMPHGVVQGANTIRTYESVLVCSIQTLASRGVPADVGFVVVDEAHGCAGSKAYMKLFEATRGVPICGVSATPVSKGLGRHCEQLGGPLFESLVAAATTLDLIKLGFLVDVDVYAPTDPDLSGVRVVAGDYHEGQLADAVNRDAIVGDVIQHWFRLANGKQTVCFAVNIAHSKHIVEQFVSAGVPAEHIDFRSSDEDRHAVLGRFNRGEVRVISNVGILSVGWDSPACEVMILARPTRSMIKYRQMVGRILRPAPGKERALLLDHSGSCKRLGFPTDDLPLELDDGKPNQSGKRERDERVDPLPKACPSCHYLKPAKVHACPKCGFAPQKRSDVTVESGELTKISRSNLKTADKEILYAEFLGYARSKGYKDGWAYHAIVDYCGSAPRARAQPLEPSPDTLGVIQHLNIRRAKAKARTGFSTAVAA